VLDPIARVSEILFGLIMALTFTGTLGAATAGREEVRTLLVGAIGCNIAWGLVDAVMFVMSALTERGHGLLTLRAVHDARSPEEAHRIIAAAIPPVVASTLSASDFEKVRVGLLHMRDLPPKASPTRDDYVGAAAVFLLVFLSTFPVVIPFLVFQDVRLALRASNLIALVMMFAAGYWLARHGGHHPWRAGFAVMTVGVVLVAIAIALGG
jgi:VIT1/CCC1 family predicted Fe2+/Mn2+ transporter